MRWGLLLLFGTGCLRGELTLFSAIDGQVLESGRPVEGVVLERRWRWRADGSDTAVTGPDGRFAFPRVTHLARLGLPPHEPFVQQTLLIERGDQVFKGFLFTRRDYRDNSEAQGRPLQLECRLESPFQTHGDMSGVCELR